MNHQMESHNVSCRFIAFQLHGGMTIIVIGIFIAQAEVKTHSIELNFNSWPGGGLAATGGGLQQLALLPVGMAEVLP